MPCFDHKLDQISLYIDKDVRVVQALG